MQTIKNNIQKGDNMNIVKIAMIEALIDEIADRNGNVEKFPSLNTLREYDGEDTDMLKLKIYALEKGVI